MIRYLPKLDTLLWSLKSQEVFASLDDLKSTVAAQRTAFYRGIGKVRPYRPDDVILQHLHDRDPFMGWRNYCSVVLDGIIIGYCGE